MFFALDSATRLAARFATTSARTAWLKGGKGRKVIPPTHNCLKNARWETINGVEVGTLKLTRAPMTAEQQALTAQWLPLAYKWVHKFAAKRSVHPDTLCFEELISYAQELLMRAAVTYREGAGAKFATYASNCILRGLPRAYDLCQRAGLGGVSQKLVNERQQPKKEFSIMQGEFEDYWQEELLHGEKETPLHWNRRTREQVLSIIEEETNERAAYLCGRVWLDDNTLQTVSEEIGMSKERVRQVLLQVAEKDSVRKRILAEVEM